MQIINNLVYPILNIFGYPTPWEHPMFSNILRKADDAEREIFLKEHNSKISTEMGIPDVFVSRQPVTAVRRANWPLFALDPEDYEDMGYDNVRSVDDTLSAIWAGFFHNDIPEVVTGDTWDKAFEYDSEGYDRWLREVRDNLSVHTLMIRPKETVVIGYMVHYAKEAHYECSFGIHMSQLFYFHINWKGFVSKNVNLPKALNTIAKLRDCTIDEAYFQEDIYNYLRYVYYKQSEAAKALPLIKGHPVSSESGKYANFTDIPMNIIVSND